MQDIKIFAITHIPSIILFKPFKYYTIVLSMKPLNLFSKTNKFMCEYHIYEYKFVIKNFVNLSKYRWSNPNTTDLGKVGPFFF